MQSNMTHLLSGLLPLLLPRLLMGLSSSLSLDVSPTLFVSFSFCCILSSTSSFAQFGEVGEESQDDDFGRDFAVIVSEATLDILI